MTSAPTNLDFLAAIFVVIILTISVLTLFGMGILMAVGAVFSSRPLVTSWPDDQQHSFAPFERRGTMANSQAWAISLIGAVVLTFVATGIYFGVAPDKKNLAKDMNMSNLTKKRPAAVAPKADPAPKPDATAPAAPAPAPAEAPKPDSPAPAPAEAPKP
jgi:hypothetical protein